MSNNPVKLLKRKSRKKRSGRYVYKLMQGGIEVARVDSATDREARREINHYAFMYEPDGPVKIVRVRP